tara:strand:- start:5564 stop:6625 length:1062 start_codon:yes stop_codon:yes gene_type:complete
MSTDFKITKTDKRYFTKTPPPSNADGTGNKPLEEPIPRYLNRTGDIEFHGNNNTLIVLGRDRNPASIRFGGETKTQKPDLDQMVSGFSNYQGAGAIDIVVGRGAPFPVESSKGADKPQGQAPRYIDGEGPTGDLSYNGTELREGTHNGTIMDAARIYMSQMCQIDDYFNLPDSSKLKYDNKPSSAIIMKADRLRMHSRRDIKIIAGSQVSVDSNGFKFKEDGGIHLMSKHNGIYMEQQPIPLGNNLVRCLKAIVKQQQETVSTMHRIFLSQMKLNAQLMVHTHVGASGAVAFNPAVLETGIGKILDDIGSMINIFGLNFINGPFAIENTYLEPLTKQKQGNQFYINSLKNTTN